eukprot:jgi/Botrbrau1/13288/Bobra.27_2s0008.1
MPLASAVQCARANFHAQCPDFQDDLSDDPYLRTTYMSMRFPPELCSLLHGQRQRSLLALLAQNRLLEVMVAAVRHHMGIRVGSAPGSFCGSTWINDVTLEILLSIQEDMWLAVRNRFTFLFKYHLIIPF